MTDNKYQLLVSKYEKLENILNRLCEENERLSDDFFSSNGKMLTGSIDESIHFMRKILNDHKNHYLSEYENDDEDFLSFLKNEDSEL